MAPKRKRAGAATPASRDTQRPKLHNQCKQPCTISGSLPMEPLKKEYSAFVPDLCLCPSMVSPFEELPVAALGQYRICSYADQHEGAFHMCCPCVGCTTRCAAAGYDGQRGRIFCHEPLVLVDAVCLCHGEDQPADGQPDSAEMCDKEVQTELLCVDAEVQVDSEDLTLSVSDAEVDDVKVDDSQVSNVKVGNAQVAASDVKKPTQAYLRRQRRVKERKSKSDVPLLPFSPRT